jgi:hypothetical protein
MTPSERSAITAIIILELDIVILPIKSRGNPRFCLFRDTTSATFGGSIGRAVLSRDK